MPVVDERPVDSTAGSNGRAWGLFQIDWSRAAWIGVALYASWALRHFLQDGLPLDFDAHSHLSRAGFVERAFAAGRYPAWANDWYGGYRLLEFYSPLWYWLSAATSLVLRDLVLAVKLVVWAAQVSSVLVLFALVKRISARTLPAVLAAVLLIHSAERGMVFGVVGNYPSTLLYLTIPALLLFAWDCSEGKIAPMCLFAGQSLLLGVMLAAHFANAILVLPAILSFEVTRIVQARSGRRDKAKAFIAIGASLVVALALVAFMLVPAILHLDRASLVLEGATIAADRISLERLLVAVGFVPGGFTHLFLRDHGAFWMALGIVAGIASLSGAYRTWLPLFAGLCASLVTITLVDERAAIGLAFFLYPLCALAFDAVSRRAKAFGLRGAMLVIPAAGIVVAIAFPVEVLVPRYMPASSFDVYRSIPESATRSRTFDVSPTTISLDGFYGPSSFSPYLSGRAIPFGAYPQGASPATQVRLALTSILVRELSGPRPAISDDALDVLYLDHVQFLVDRGRSPATSRLQLANGIGEPLTPELLRLQHASPAVFATQLAPLPDWVRAAGARKQSPRLLGVLEQAWQEYPVDGAGSRSLDPLFRTRERQDWKVFLPLLRAMELDRTQASATRIFVDELLGPKGPSSSGPLSFDVLSHLEEPSRARIVARASQAGYVRLSYPRDPDQTVSLDGELAETTSDSLGGAITLAFPAGTHSIEVRAPAPILQTRYLWLSLSLILLLAAGLVRERRATRSPGRRQVPRA
jgi:hypothetical protein